MKPLLSISHETNVNTHIAHSFWVIHALLQTEHISKYGPHCWISVLWKPIQSHAFTWWIKHANAFEVNTVGISTLPTLSIVAPFPAHPKKVSWELYFREGDENSLLDLSLCTKLQGYVRKEMTIKNPCKSRYAHRLLSVASEGVAGEPDKINPGDQLT